MSNRDFTPTHVVPRSGMPAWEGPDTSRPTEPLDPLLPVQLLERRGDWSRILCVNGWSAWVDGRLLVSVPQDPPAAGQPMARTADPRPLLARVEDSLGRYRRAAEDLVGGHSDGEDFRRRTQGLRVGLVVDGEAMWLYDAEHERWVFCDGTRLTTLAATSEPAASTDTPDQPPPARRPDPTQVVPDSGADDGAGRAPAPDSTWLVDPARPSGPLDGPAPRPTGSGETELVDPAPLAPYRDPDAEHPDATRFAQGPGRPPARGGDG
ncbi:hypothetical protein J7E88_19510 [Streptomyces sp. ISL-10]|nr:hypothetical protein [Streptomyces sp. ISL-10]MBT2367431.1 hypothetical protein [Streptomyces sp. ISL-10]